MNSAAPIAAIRFNGATHLFRSKSGSESSFSGTERRGPGSESVAASPQHLQGSVTASSSRPGTTSTGWSTDRNAGADTRIRYEPAGGTDSINVTINVTDLREQPEPEPEPVPVPALPGAGAVGLGLLLLGAARRALRARGGR